MMSIHLRDVGTLEGIISDLFIAGEKNSSSWEESSGMIHQEIILLSCACDVTTTSEPSEITEFWWVKYGHGFELTVGAG